MNQLKAGALLSYLIIGINMIVGLVYTPYMLRTLGQSEYGMYSLAASVIAYLTVLDLGFANAIIRYTAKFRAEGKKEEQYELFGMFFKLYAGIGIIALLIGLGILSNVNNLFGDTMTLEELSKMKVLMLLMSFNLAFTFPMSIFGAIISAYENFVFQRVVNLIRVVLNPLIMVVLLFFGYKAIAMVVITTLFNVITLSINCWYCFHKLDIKIYLRKFNIPLLKEIAAYSLWIFLAMIMNKIYWSLGQFVLGVYQGADSVAVYAVSIQLVLMFFAFNSAIHSMFLPKLTAMISKGATDVQISDTFIKTGRLQFAVMSLVVSTFILIGKEFVIFWAGTSYELSYTITLILIIPMMFVMIQSVGLSIMQARKTVKFNSLLSIFMSVLCVGVSIPMSVKYSEIGCATATAVSLIIGSIIILNVYYSIKQNLDIKKFWLNIVQMGVTPSILILCFFLIKKQFNLDSLFSVILFALLFAGVYIVCFWFVSLKKYEKDMILIPLKGVLKRINK